MFDGELNDADNFIKRPVLDMYDPEDPNQTTADVLGDEISSLEIIKQHPHPGLMRYLGCIVLVDRIRGLVSTRLKIVLKDRPQAHEEHQTNIPRTMAVNWINDLASGLDICTP